MQNQAEVVQLESQLTVPSRNRSHLSDLWIAISCTENLAAWAAEFNAIVSGSEDREATSGTLQVVAMSERTGWVVARGVDLSTHDSAHVEKNVRSVVMRVNRGVAPLPTVDSNSTPTPQSWSIGATLRSGGNVVRRLLSSSRTGPAVDAMSGH